MSDKEEFEIEEQLGGPAGEMRERAREFMGEVLGTFVLTVLGHGAVLQMALHPKADALVAQLTVGLGIGLGLAMAVFTAGHSSGGHVSPAITLAFAAFRGFPWRKVPAYLLAQFVGSLLAGGALVLFNFPALAAAPAPARLAMFASLPPPGASYGIAFVNITLGSALLLVGVMALSDPRNACPPWLVPLGLALLVLAISLVLPGYPLSPAWDLAFRLVAMAVAKSPTFRFAYAPIPIVAPLIGGPLGIAIYDAFLPAT